MILTQLEYFGKKISGICDNSTLDLIEEKFVNGYRICLVKKRMCFGVDIFYKNGSLNQFLDCKSYDEAKKLFDNGLINKYKKTTS